ncbi:MAG: tRNA pseudouridine(38-40) synthase TruA [Bdellovibrionota bacterium]
MSQKTRLRMTVSYDGTDFCGWQKQTHENRSSVQEILQTAFERVFQEKLTLYASGRTDAGVHARSQVIHFDVSRSEQALKGWDIPWAVKRSIPDSISVKRVWVAPTEFHANLSPIGKTYKYYIWNHPRFPAFMNRYSLWVRKELNLDLMQEFSKLVLGEHDFKSFQSVGTPIKTTVRKIESCGWRVVKPHLIEFEITGSGFLKQMVRNIVGTQLLLEKKEMGPSDFKHILEARNRVIAGPPAEPQGLFLHQVYYPSRLDKQCREI